MAPFSDMIYSSLLRTNKRHGESVIKISPIHFVGPETQGGYSVRTIDDCIRLGDKTLR